MKNLAEIKKNKKVKIISYKKGEGGFSLFISLGILKGDIIEVVSESFLGSPISIRFGLGEMIALRPAQAKLIEVEELK